MRRWLPGASVIAALSLATLPSGCKSPDEDDGTRDDGGRDGVGGDADADVVADDGSRDDGTGDWVDDGTCVQALDIVFVLDVSTSMTPVLGALHDGIADVWSYAGTIAADPLFGLVVFVDDVRVTNEGLPFSSVGTIQNEFSYWRDFCSSNLEPGSGSGFNNDCPENTIDALWDAATRFPWRADSLRVIILATDDTFVENPETLGSSRIVVQHGYPELIAELRSREIRVAAFAAHDSTNCVGFPFHDTSAGFFTSYGADPPFGDATGAGVFDIMDFMPPGTLSMTSAINDVILEEYCTPYIY